MKVAYYVTTPRGPQAALEAVMQEVTALRRQTGGPLLHLYPGRRPGTRLPRRWWGLTRLPQMRRLERDAALHHIFNPDPYPFAVLGGLRRPVVYTAVTGVGRAPRAAVVQTARRVHTLVVPTAADAAALRQWGVTNTAVIAAGIDSRRFYPQPVPERPLTLLAGSAPWTVDQFQSKGVDALLAAAQRRPDLRLVFLWRGVLTDEMARRVAAAGLQERVRVLNEQVDVNAVLAGVHAAVALAAEPALLKAFPHSLLEALLAGRPVLVSSTLPLADYVAQNGCGVPVTAVTADGILAALDTLLAGYDDYRQRARPAAARDFSLDAFVQAYLRLYAQVSP